MHFEIQVQERGDAIRVTILGELDLATAPELERTLGEIEASTAATIILDLDQVEFLDSTGLRTLLEADSRSRANGARLRLTRGSPPVRRLLHLVGADTRLPFTDAGQTAVLARAREVEGEAARRWRPAWPRTPDALDGFATMAGAGDWSIVGVIDERARDLAVGMLVDWALPIEKRHDGSLPLAAAEDPEETD